MAYLTRHYAKKISLPESSSDEETNMDGEKTQTDPDSKPKKKRKKMKYKYSSSSGDDVDDFDKDPSWSRSREHYGSKRTARTLTAIPVREMPDVYTAILARLPVDKLNLYDKYAIQNLIVYTCFADDKFNDFNQIVEHVYNVVVADKTMKYFKYKENGDSAIGVRERDSDMLRRYNEFIHSDAQKEKRVYRNEEIRVWTEEEVARFKEAFKKHGYQPTSNRKIAEFVGNGIHPKQVAYFKHKYTREQKRLRKQKKIELEREARKAKLKEKALAKNQAKIKDEAKGEIKEEAGTDKTKGLPMEDTNAKPMEGTKAVDVAMEETKEGPKDPVTETKGAKEATKVMEETEEIPMEKIAEVPKEEVMKVEPEEETKEIPMEVTGIPMEETIGIPIEEATGTPMEEEVVDLETKECPLVAMGRTNGESMEETAAESAQAKTNGDAMEETTEEPVEAKANGDAMEEIMKKPEAKTNGGATEETVEETKARESSTLPAKDDEQNDTRTEAKEGIPNGNGQSAKQGKKRKRVSSAQAEEKTCS
eukprot:TRINITY_DN7637_c0_g1_i1.p1 TRINITY_DN7637_c0_g1~~TRINITY_DN7637_c0_g1_i1.p1  ORF type:complete len:535 (-),score=154.23 TRINITY_DN7637_c0_g1_i1:45-1649(-)